MIAGLGSLIQTADAEAETVVFKFQRGEIDGDAFLKEYVEKKKVSRCLTIFAPIYGIGCICCIALSDY